LTPFLPPKHVLRNIKVGSNISLTILRDGKESMVSYVVTERPLLPGDVAGPNASFTPVQVAPAGQRAPNSKARLGFYF
jgi:hypothetical protein